MRESNRKCPTCRRYLTRAIAITARGPVDIERCEHCATRDLIESMNILADVMDGELLTNDKRSTG